MFLTQQMQSIQGIRQGLLCYISSRHIAAVNNFPLNKPGTQDTCLSLSFKSLASHKLGRSNASQALRAKCVVGGGEFGGWIHFMDGSKDDVIVWLPLGQKILLLAQCK